MGFCWWKRLSCGVLSCIHCVDFVPDSLCRFSCCVDFHVVGFGLMEFCPPEILPNAILLVEDAALWNSVPDSLCRCARRTQFQH